MYKSILENDSDLSKKIESQWDKLANIRNNQQRYLHDETYENYLKPTILDLLKKSDLSHVLDLGCGNGYLTEFIAKQAKRVTGIDISHENIKIAKKNNQLGNLTYFKIDAFDYLINNKNKFSTIVASMFLQDCANFKDISYLVYDNLNKSGKFILTITHPCYWPRYWGYENEDWFSYGKELIIEGNFKISSIPEPLSETIHFHRPLEMYLDVFKNAGFILDDLIEIQPNHTNTNFKYPRFLAIQYIKS